MENKLPVRKNIRLKNYDYSQNGAYYITICAQGRLNIFGEIDEGISVGADLASARANLNHAACANLNHTACVNLNHAGQMIEQIYIETISSFDDVVSDNYIVMPNHLHCILSIRRADTRSAPTAAICNVVQAFKSKTTVEYINGVKSGIFPPFNKRIWQRNYYEEIIRNEERYREIWQYIDENPIRLNEGKR